MTMTPRRTLILALLGVTALCVLGKQTEDLDLEIDVEEVDEYEEHYMTKEQKNKRQIKKLAENRRKKAYKAVKKSLRKAIIDYAIDIDVISQDQLVQKTIWNEERKEFELKPDPKYKFEKKNFQTTKLRKVISGLQSDKTKKIVMKDSDFIELLKDADEDEEETLEPLSLYVIEKYISGKLPHVPAFPEPKAARKQRQQAKRSSRNKKKTRRNNRKAKTGPMSDYEFQRAMEKIQRKSGSGDMASMMGEITKNPRLMQAMQERMSGDQMQELLRQKGAGSDGDSSDELEHPSEQSNMFDKFKDPNFMDQMQNMMKNPQMMEQMQNMMKNPQMQNMMKNMNGGKGMPDMGNLGDMMKGFDPSKFDMSKMQDLFGDNANGGIDMSKLGDMMGNLGGAQANSGPKREADSAEYSHDEL